MAQVKEDTPSEKMFEHQLGINASRFLSSVLRVTDPLDGSPYDFNYKLLYRTDPEKMYFSSVGLRFGAGWILDNMESSNPVAQTAFTRSFKIFDMRAGVEAQKQLSKYWTAYAGLDYVGKSGTDETQNTFISGGVQRTSITSEKDRAEGGGAILGIQFNASKHICLSTEVSYYFFKGNRDSYQDSGFPGSQVQWRHEKYSRSEITSPFFINFNFRF